MIFLELDLSKTAHNIRDALETVNSFGYGVCALQQRAQLYDLMYKKQHDSEISHPDL